MKKENRLLTIDGETLMSQPLAPRRRAGEEDKQEQLCAFLSEHPDTVLVIIDTLQMIRGTGYDNTYAASSRTSYPAFPPAPKTHSFRRSSFSVQNRFARF